MTIADLPNLATAALALPNSGQLPLTGTRNE